MTKVKEGPLHLKYRPSTLDELVGNAEAKASLKSVLEKPDETRPRVFLFVGESGCVDCDTEYLSPEGWKPISQYKGEKVLQWNKDGTAEFVTPYEYIKRKSDKLTLFQTKYGVNQCLSDDHRVLYKTPKGKLHVKKFSEIKEQHENSVYGFHGRFLTTFLYKSDSNLLLDEYQLRVQVAVNLILGNSLSSMDTDCAFPESRGQCHLRLKSRDKINRLNFLLRKADILFFWRSLKNGDVQFNFVPPKRIGFTPDYYKCSMEQLETIKDEMVNWYSDNNRKRFTMLCKSDADFVQFVFSATGTRASIYTRKRKDRIEYIVQPTRNPDVGIHSNKKVVMKEITPVDGYEYCFVVPSSYLVLRRKDKIFVTGNCGKTSMARIVKNYFNISEMDFFETNAAEQRGIDDIRKIIEKATLQPMNSKYKMFLLDEVHQLTKDAKETLLKFLEDTPPHVIVCLCTTEPFKLASTLKSRCALFQVFPLVTPDMVKFLKKILQEEGKNIPVNVLRKITISSEGRPREALVMLDKVMDLEDTEMMIRVIETTSSVTTANVIDLCRALLKHENWNNIASILKTIEGDIEGIRRAILGYMSKVLLNKENDRAAMIIEQLQNSYVYVGKPGLIKDCYLLTVLGDE